MNQYYKYIYQVINNKWLSFVITLLFISGCSDTDYGNPSDDGAVNLTLHLATTRSGEAAADDDIYNLRIIIFNEAGTSVIHNWMLYDDTTPLSTTLGLGLAAENYKVYLIANAKGSTSPTVTGTKTLENVTNETELNALLITYNDNLPVHPFVMVCKDELNLSGKSGNINHTFYLNYTCVKVSYTINFDNNHTNISELLRGKQFELRNIQLKNLANQSYLMNDNAESVINTNSIFDGDALAVFKDSDGDDIDFTADTWTYTGTVYLPEQIYDDPGADPISCMVITAGIVGSSVNSTYKVNLIGKKDVSGYKHTPRATEYTFTGQILTPGDKDGLEYTLGVAGWVPQIIHADLEGNYTLQVSKTRANVGSLISDEVFYETNAPSLTYESTKVTVDGNEKDLFVITEDITSKRITIEINPEIKAGTDLTGVDTYIYIVAGKLKKKIDIDCDLTPMLRVTPPKYTVNLSDEEDDNWKRTFTYVTNMNEINVQLRDDKGVITIQNPSLSVGSEEDLVCLIDKNKTFLLNRSYTVYLDFTATSLGIGTLTETVEIVLIPENPLYRLHFRDINDSWTNPHIYAYDPLYTPSYQEVFVGNIGENALLYSWTGNRKYKYREHLATSGSEVTDNNQYENVDYNSGWASVCNCATCENSLNSYSSSINSLNYKWPGIGMAKDPENAGWWYYDIPAGASPGITLLMFADTHNPSDGGILSDDKRYPAHMVPGMTLYNYEDKDGWFLYDTDNKLHEFVDEKPTVGLSVDVTYRIWVNSASHTTPHIHIWSDKGNTGNIEGSNVPLKLKKDNSTGKFYYDLTPDILKNTLKLENGWKKLTYLLTASTNWEDNKKGNFIINWFDWSNNQVTVTY